MFFNEEGILDLDNFLAGNVSFQRIMEDGVVTAEELADQSDKIVAILRHIEETYSDDQISEVKDLLVEVSALFTAHNVYSIQEIDNI